MGLVRRVEQLVRDAEGHGKGKVGAQSAQRDGGAHAPASSSYGRGSECEHGGYQDDQPGERGCEAPASVARWPDSHNTTSPRMPYFDDGHSWEGRQGLEEAHGQQPRALVLGVRVRLPSEPFGGLCQGQQAQGGDC
eukprot:2084649-Prymnesium_polylepis.1